MRVYLSVRAKGDTKTRKSRRLLKLPKKAVEALKEHRKRQAAERLQAGEQWQDLALIFCREDGTPLDRWQVRREREPGQPALATCGTLRPLLRYPRPARATHPMRPTASVCGHVIGLACHACLPQALAGVFTPNALHGPAPEPRIPRPAGYAQGLKSRRTGRDSGHARSHPSGAPGHVAVSAGAGPGADDPGGACCAAGWHLRSWLRLAACSSQLITTSPWHREQRTLPVPHQASTLRSDHWPPARGPDGHAGDSRAPGQVGLRGHVSHPCWVMPVIRFQVNAGPAQGKGSVADR